MRWLKAIGFLITLGVLVALLLTLIWAIAKVGLIVVSFFAGVVIGYCIPRAKFSGASP